MLEIIAFVVQPLVRLFLQLMQSLSGTVLAITGEYTDWHVALHVLTCAHRSDSQVKDR